MKLKKAMACMLQAQWYFLWGLFFRRLQARMTTH